MRLEGLSIVLSELRGRLSLPRISLALLTGFYLILLPAEAADRSEPAAHGFSLYGTLALERGFPHFPYVNPQAPKGGELRTRGLGSFDNLNRFTIKGQTAVGLELIYDTLLTSSADEPGSAYGLLAHSIAVAPDGLSATFFLRREAKFHDGRPVTAEDVVWSFDAIRAAHPFYAAYYHSISRAVADAPDQVTFYFEQSGNRELPLIVGQFAVLPKHYWTQNGRSLKDTTLEPPVGSGPYRIARVDNGRIITYQRDPNYWGRNLNVNIGRHNFALIRFDYFGDDGVSFEAFKAGEMDLREEFSSKNWATGYAIEAVKSGAMLVEEIDVDSGGGMQAFVMNTRRTPFDNRAVRQAFNLAFDFEWTNKNLFYGQYARTESFFGDGELAATGLPSAAELALLEPLRDALPSDVFTTAFENPKTAGDGNVRTNLREARRLLASAGWEIANGRLEKQGQPLEVEFLLVQPGFERIVAPYIKNLEKLGVAARIRLVDPTQYQNRLNGFDFDIIVDSFGQSLSPGNEQRDYWSSESADREGGRNMIGIRNPAIDALVDKIIFADTRAALIAATRALDRVLLWSHYVVPQWHAPRERVAYWRGLSYPKPLPRHSLGFPDIWWRSAPPPYSSNHQDATVSGDGS
jgi:microcin C transport system substrate-binding protein